MPGSLVAEEVDVEGIKAAALIWLRSFSIVTLTATNVVMVSRGHYYAAFWTGSLLSFTWWFNTRTAASSNVRGAAFFYAFGAGCGTVFGMFLGRLLL